MYKFTYDGKEYLHNTYKELCQDMFYGLCEGCQEEAEMEGIEMTIYASCGHVVEDMDDMYDVAVKGEARCGAPCVNYKSVCLSCYNWYKEQDMLLYSERDEKIWLKQNKPCCGMC